MRRFNLGALVDRERDAERVLLVDCREEDAPVEWTGARLEQAADAVARGLLARGLERGERVAILSANRAEHLCAYLGTMRAGLVAVPVNHRLPAETVRYVIADSGARLVFADREHRALAPPGVPVVDFDDSAAYAGALDPGPLEPVRPGRGEVAMLLYTSGSTGEPKGVPLTHRGHLWVIEQRFQPGVDYRAQRVLVAAPLYHMNALAVTKFALAAGATVILLPRFAAASYVRAIARHRCTWITSVPTMLALVTQETELLARSDLSSVRSVRMGSAPVTSKLLARIREAFPGARIQLGYGTTEAGPIVFGPHPAGLAAPELALGYPHPAVELRLAGAAPEGEAEGVLEMRCPALMPGYHNLPEKTASVMTEDGYYHTGDVMRRDADGFYFFVGRDDDMFVCNGENVYPEEVERVLESHPAIAQAAVVPVPDEVRGQMPVAFVVPRNGARLDEETVKRHALERGPAYQHPRRVFLADRLPLASTNKIDRRVLGARAAALVAAPSGTTEPAPPASPSPSGGPS